MKCFNCGKEIRKKTNFCPDCGACLSNYEESKDEIEEAKTNGNEAELEIKNKDATPKKNNKMGLAGFIVALCGLCGLSFSTSIVGLVFSAIGMSGFDAKTQKNKGFAVAGLVLAIVALSLIAIRKLAHWNWGFIW